MGYWITVDGDGSHVLVFPGDDGDSQEVWSSDGESAWVSAGAMSVPRRYYSTATSPDGFLYLHAGYAADERVKDGFYSRIDADGVLALDCVP